MMGKVFSLVTKPFREYNLESRAHKFISKDKPMPAPKYKVDAEQHEKLMKDHPEIIEEIVQKHGLLDQHLKKVFVTSFDPVEKTQKTVSDNTSNEKALPLDRKAVEYFEYGLKEPNNVPKGRVTLKSVLQFISDHQMEETLHNVDAIAKKYSLPEKNVDDILKYFRVYEIYIPEKPNSKATFAGAKLPERKIRTAKPKQLPQTDKKDSNKT